MPPRKRPRSESADPPQPTRASRRLRSQEPEVKPVASPAQAVKQRRNKKVATRTKAATKNQQPKKSQPQPQQPLPSIQEESVAPPVLIDEIAAVQSDSAEDADHHTVSSSQSASQTPAPDASLESSQDLSPPSQEIIREIVSLSSSDEETVKETVKVPKKVSSNVTVEIGRVTRSRSRSQQSQQSQESESHNQSDLSQDSQHMESPDEAQISRESQEAESKRQAQLSQQSQHSESSKEAQQAQPSQQSESPKQISPPQVSQPDEAAKSHSESEASESADNVFAKKSKYRIPVAANKRATRSRTASQKKELETVEEVKPSEAASASASDGNNSADEVRPSVEDEEVRKQKKIAERKIIVDRFKKGMAVQYAKQDAEKAAAEKAKAAKEQAEKDDAKAMPPPPPKKRGRPPKSVATARKSLAMTTEINEEGATQAATLETNPDDSDDEDGAVRESATSSTQGQAYMMSGALNASPSKQKTPQRKTPRQPRRRHISPPGPPSSSPLSVLSHTPTLLGDYASPSQQLSPLASRSSILSNPPVTPQQTNPQGTIVQPQTTATGWRRFLTPISKIATIFRRAPQTAPVQSFADRLGIEAPQQSMTSVEQSPLDTNMPSRMSGHNRMQILDSSMFDDEEDADATMADYQNDENEADMSDDDDEFLWSLPRTPGHLNQGPLGSINQGEAPQTAPIKRFVGTPGLWTGRRAIPATERIRRAKERETRLAREERLSREEASLKRRVEHQRRNHFRRLYGPKPGQKRKYHVMVDKMGSIPNPPGGGYGMYDKFFEQGDDSDDDIVSVSSEDGIANVGYDAFSPISRKRMKFAREGVEAFMENSNYNAAPNTYTNETVGDFQTIIATPADVTGGPKITTATPVDNAGGLIEGTAAPTDVVAGPIEGIAVPAEVVAGSTGIVATRKNIFSQLAEDPFAHTVVPHKSVDEATTGSDAEDAKSPDDSKSTEEALVTHHAATSSKKGKEKEWKPKNFEEEMYGKPTFTFEYSDTESDGEGDSDFPVLEEEFGLGCDADYPDLPDIPIPLRAKMLKVIDMEVVKFLHLHGHTLTNDEWALLEDYPSDDESIRSSKNDPDDETWAQMKKPYEFLKYVYDTIVHTKLDPYMEARYFGKLRNLRKRLENRPFPLTDSEVPNDLEATQDNNIFALSSNTTPPTGLTPSKEVETPQTPSSAVETPAESSSSADERAEDQKALARARERAEVHKPKTPSRLREVSRVASSPLAPVTPENHATNTAMLQVPATAPPAVQPPVIAPPAVEPPAIRLDYTDFDFGQARCLTEDVDPEILARLDEDAKKPEFEKAAWETYGPTWQAGMAKGNQIAAERLAAA